MGAGGCLCLKWMVFIVWLCNSSCISRRFLCLLLIVAECVLLCVCVCFLSFLWIPIKRSSAPAQSCWAWIIFLVVNGKRVFTSMWVSVDALSQMLVWLISASCWVFHLSSSTRVCACVRVRVLSVCHCQPPSQATDGERAPPA